ncbi:PREDICTED: ran-binding protein 10 [Camelina sativa]|uniref:Ran-binding protein 10 n=1 Tax=Camelina sativa TaxID=90675 RepID=A0ABM0VFD2_CAMSA|nr:PREDICTED: ran-binding protein 10 [Camelina sativa]
MNNSYFLHKFRHSSKPYYAMEDDEEGEEESPTELNTINGLTNFVIISPDKLSLKYTGVAQHGHDVGVVQSNKPAPCKRLAYYFEIYVKDAGVKGRVAIGFTTDSFRIARQPGWEVNTCGYHGEDGLIYLGKRQGEAFGPTYTTGDTVGGGINYDSQEFFFTVNGTLVGTVSKYIKGPLFPTVAVHSQNEEVTVNFGQEKFAFDFKGYQASERNKQQIEFDMMSIPPNICHGLVKNYLLHYGYEDTLHAFDLATKSIVCPINGAVEDNIDVQDTSYALHERKIFRQLIGKGDIDAALAKLRDCYPQLVQNDKSEVCFLLHCQKFIELVRIGALEEAVKYGRVELAKFIGLTAFKDIIEDCFALLVYERPQESTVGYFLAESQREVVADAVNAAILSTSPNTKDQSSHSRLETLLRQLTAGGLEMRSLNDGQGEVFSLHQLLMNNSNRKRTKKTG